MSAGKIGRDRPVARNEATPGYSADNAAYLDERYSMRRLERVEHGEDGEVRFHVAYDKLTGADVMLKEHDERTIKRADAEVAVLNALHSPKVMKLIDTVRVQQPTEDRHKFENKCYLVFEFQPAKLEIKNEQDVWKVLKQVMSAVRDMHRINLVHGGISRQSLFGGNDRILLGNLGRAKRFGEDESATSYPGQDVRDIWQLGREMFAGLRQDSLSHQARSFVEKAKRGGGATFLHLQWKYFLATGRWSGPNQNAGRPLNFLKTR